PPSAFSSSPAVTRVTWSVEPPAAQGTMIVIGFVGFHSAEAGMASDSAASAAAACNARLIIGTPPKIIGACFESRRLAISMALSLGGGQETCNQLVISRRR